MKLEEKTTIYIDFEHINKFQGESDLGESLLSNFYRFEPYLKRAVYQFMFKMAPEYSKDKAFFTAFYNLANTLKLRELKTHNIGHLASIYGTVTRTTEVRPELLNGSFRCEDCNSIIRDVDQ